jgi:hypothetical protein
MPGIGRRDNPAVVTVKPVAPLNPVSPIGSPALAGSPDTFSPTFSSYQSGAPQIAMWTKAGQAGKLIALTGTFPAGTTFWAYGQTTSGNDAFLPCVAIRQTTLKALVQLPAGLPAHSMYLLYAVDSSSRASYPAIINQAESWRLQDCYTGQPSTLTAAGNMILWNNASEPTTLSNVCSFKGRNLSNAFYQPGGNTSSSTELEVPTPAYNTTTQVTFTMPADLGILAGQNLSVVSSALMENIDNPAAGMWGTVYSYSGMTLVMNVVCAQGSGNTYDSWEIAYGFGYPIVANGNTAQLWCAATYNGVTIGDNATILAVNPFEIQAELPDLYGATSCTTSATTIANSGNVTITTPSAMTNWQQGLPVTLYNPTSGAGGWMSGTISSGSGTSWVIALSACEGGMSGNGPYTSWTAYPCPLMYVYPHNGHGGDLGWGQPIQVQVTCLANCIYGSGYDYRTVVQITQAPVDEATDTALWQGIHSDAVTSTMVVLAGDALSANSADNPYQLNAGVSLIGGSNSKQLRIGDGMHTIYFQVAADYNDTEALFYDFGYEFGELNNVSVDWSPFENSESSPAAPICFVHRVINCNLAWVNWPAASSGSGAIVQPGTGVSLYMIGTTMTGSGVYTPNSPFVYCDSNFLYGTQNQSNFAACYEISNSSNIHLTNNGVQHYNPSGGAAGHGTGRFSWLENAACRGIYAAYNYTPTHYGVADVSEGHDGELFGSEATSYQGTGTVVSATANTVTLNSSPGGYSYMSVAVMSGDGVGQVIPISSVDGSTYTIVTDFTVIPSPGDTINIVMIYEQWVAFGNIMAGNQQPGVYTGDDTQGWSIYGGAAEFCAECNIFVNMEYGFSEWQFGPDTGGGGSAVSMPIFFPSENYNMFLGVNGAMSVGCRIIPGGLNNGETDAFLGAMRRGNVFSGFDTLITDYFDDGGYAIGLQHFPIDLDVWEDCSLIGSINGIGLTDEADPNLWGDDSFIILSNTTIQGAGLSGSAAVWDNWNQVVVSPKPSQNNLILVNGSEFTDFATGYP